MREPAPRPDLRRRDGHRYPAVAGAALLALCLATACGSGDGGAGGRAPAEESAADSAGTAAGVTRPEDAPVRTIFDSLPEGLSGRLLAPWTGDLSGMTERRIIRLLTVFARQFFFLDGPQARGIVAELAHQFENHLNERLGRRHLRVQVIVVPVTRDQLIPSLLDGRGDIAAANLTITRERLAVVDFSDPFLTGVREIVVTGPTGPVLGGLRDLSGRQVEVRRSSSYWESLEALNARFAREGLPPAELVPVDEFIEDDGILELVSAGHLPLTVVDSHQAEFWERVLSGIELHPELAVRTEGEIAWAFRKNSPELRAVLNDFVREHRRGTLIGNILARRYLLDTTYVRPRTLEADRRFRRTASLFQTYADRYDLDWLLLAAQAYQESHLDQGLRSSRGAVGVMQLLPSTAKEVGIDGIETVEANIHAGARYMRHLIDTYFDEPELQPTDRQVLALAGYNAGPNRINRLRRKAAQAGYDPNRWFNNVEIVAAHEIGGETVRYVANIAKYWVAYRLFAEREELSGAADVGNAD